MIFTISGFIVNDDVNDYAPYMLALFGRFFVGLGGETLSVCQVTILAKYFKNKELSFAIGTYYSWTWLGTPCWNYVIPLISERTSLGIALTFANIMWIFSLGSAIAFIYLDLYVNQSTTLELDDNVHEEFHWKDIKDLSFPFWLIMVNSEFIFVSWLYDSISNDYFSTRYGFNQVEASKFGANANLVFIVITPIFGLIIDKIGHRVTGMIITAICLITSQALFIIIPSSTSSNKSYLGYLQIMVLQIGLAVYYASMFPTIPLVAKPQVHGTAFGISASFNNLALTTGSLLISPLIIHSQKENAYLLVNIALFSSGVLALITSLYLLIYSRLYLHNALQIPNVRS